MLAKSAQLAATDIAGTSQLAALIRASGPTIKIRKRLYKVSKIAIEEGVNVAHLEVPFAAFKAVLRANGSVNGYPGAEVWTVLNDMSVVVTFAVHNGQLLTLI